MPRKKKPSTDHQVRTAASLLGKRGGAKGGRTRAQRMSPEERQEAARKAVQTRWARVRAKKKQVKEP